MTASNPPLTANKHDVVPVVKMDTHTGIVVSVDRMSAGAYLPVPIKLVDACVKCRGFVFTGAGLAALVRPLPVQVNQRPLPVQAN